MSSCQHIPTDSKIDPSACVGPYTSIGDRYQITLAEVDEPIAIDDVTIDVERKLVRSMVGKGTKTTSAVGLLPKGERLVVGENTTVFL